MTGIIHCFYDCLYGFCQYLTNINLRCWSKMIFTYVYITISSCSFLLFFAKKQVLISLEFCTHIDKQNSLRLKISLFYTKFRLPRIFRDLEKLRTLGKEIFSLLNFIIKISGNSKSLFSFTPTPTISWLGKTFD